MNEDERMLHIGIVMVVVMSILTVTLQVCYRVQNRVRRGVRQEIVQTQQNIAVAQANFAAYVRPEILQNLVKKDNKKVEGISFQKSVEIQNLPDRIENR